MANGYISSDMIEISEFPHLAIKYSVQGVPKIIINEKYSLVGDIPEMELVRAILKSIEK